MVTLGLICNYSDGQEISYLYGLGRLTTAPSKLATVLCPRTYEIMIRYIYLVCHKFQRMGNDSTLFSLTFCFTS
jgi:hypothetical protein